MGLTKSAVGIGAIDYGLILKKHSPDDYVVGLAGNPNVGKSTVFNGLTGMNQHTGNWPGKTVSNAQGFCKSDSNSYVIVDIPGTYSLLAHSAEEEIARNFICFGGADIIVVVCDATCLERNLNLVLQTLEISEKVVVCLNLMDEAERKDIKINCNRLSELLGATVVTTVAHRKKSLVKLLEAFDKEVKVKEKKDKMRITYPQEIENAIGMIEPILSEIGIKNLNYRWLSLRLLDTDKTLYDEIRMQLGEKFIDDERLKSGINLAKAYLHSMGINKDMLKDMIVSSIIETAENISSATVERKNSGYASKDRKIDKLLTGKLTGYPIMLVMLAAVFWITISGANYPSELLSAALSAVENKLALLLKYIGVNALLNDMISHGIFRVLSWVVSVMLPPMALFFPLFTLLEDAGYLPRVAYNLDKTLKRCNACGKQAITMCMGFGCNAAGIVGSRIIDSPRERLLAILTNNFVPCNGRFPMLIAIISMFFVWSASGVTASLLSALLLTIVILLGIFITFAVTKILSKTILKGITSSFTIELPPYRHPQIGKLIVRSVFDRTLFVLGRAVAVAAPAGFIIWLAANITVGNISLLKMSADFLDPFAKLFGLDGVILMAFILGFPANEIVIPIIIMAYISGGTLCEMTNFAEMRNILIANGWSWITALCTMIFSLMHWPCSTTMITVWKETKSIKWTAATFLIPTIIGLSICFFLNNFLKLFF